MVLERFEKNLIELSINNTWEEASKEWCFLFKRHRDTKDNNCLCSYLIKNQNYYYNKNTKKIICCGDGCKKHIDDYGANIEYDSNFISDLNAVMGNVSIGEFDLEVWCHNNEQRLSDRFFWRVDALMTEESLVKFAEYLNEMWFELVNLDVILDRIDEKLQAIHDKEVAESERIRLIAQHNALVKEREAKMAREQAEADEKQYQLYRDRILKEKKAEKKRVIISKKRRRKECEENISRLKDDIRQMSYELKLAEEQLLKMGSVV